jgi:uncharacterized repeat protein (TIGR03837 family)
MPPMLLDIFCRVIDNFGDIGVCWRLSADLAARGHSVRLWVDDARALQWMAPGALEGQWPGISLSAWENSCNPQVLEHLACADVWIEAFGCELPQPFVAHFAQRIEVATIDSGQSCASQIPVWINLEYLSAEPYVERSNGLPSPVMHGPAKGWTKFFFYPGFSAKTGGLLREPYLKDGARSCDTAQRAAFFQQLGIPWQGERVVSLFCYEPRLLKALLDELAASNEPVRVLVTQGRAAKAVLALLGEQTHIGKLQISHLPLLTQVNYDSLLTCCDVNFVRGEDSVLRAVWAGQPFVWHLYPQEDLAHGAKLEAFLEQMQFSATVRTLHRAWNELPDAPHDSGALACLQPQAHDEWHSEVHAARQRLFKMVDLTTCLLEFVQKKR